MISYLFCVLKGWREGKGNYWKKRGEKRSSFGSDLNR